MDDWDAELSQMLEEEYLKRQQRRGEQSGMPWLEARKWKRRFWLLAIYAMLATVLAWWLVNTSEKVCF